MLEPFLLERYFAEHEFATPHLLCSSDLESVEMRELVATADDETAALWHDLRLGYTETTGHPLLRAELAALYETVDADEVVTFAGASEAITCLVSGLVRAGRPRDRDLARLPVAVRGRGGRRRRRHHHRAPRRGRLGDRPRRDPGGAAPGNAPDRRQRAAQPHRHAALARDVARAGRARRRRRRDAALRRGLPAARARPGRSARRRRRPRRPRRLGRCAVEELRPRRPARSAGWRRATAPSGRRRYASRTTARCATRRRPRSSVSSRCAAPAGSSIATARWCWTTWRWSTT